VRDFNFAMTESATIPAPGRPWFRRIVLVLLVFVAVLAAAGFLYQNISEARDRRFNPMPGRRVNIDGVTSSLSLHIYCTGQGSPAVILESGLGDSYLSWRKVQPEIAKFTRVCSYDRAGIGYSDSSEMPRTSDVLAEELHALLLKAEIPPPYILVGHSMGGYDVRLYVHVYGDDVAGMVLVDASHPDQEKRFPPELRNMEGSWQREAEFFEYTMPIGVPRLLGFCDEDPVQRAAECNWHTAREGVAEMKAIHNSAAMAALTGALGDMPLVVLSHDPEKPSADLPADLAKPTNDAWGKMQEELARLSTRGTQAIAKNSSHYIQLDRPDLVIEAVRRVMEQERTGQSEQAPSKPTGKLHRLTLSY
jgi:pimeloyl-ACP methyl ester carboxylesterase